MAACLKFHVKFHVMMVFMHNVYAYMQTITLYFIKLGCNYSGSVYSVVPERFVPFHKYIYIFHSYNTLTRDMTKIYARASAEHECVYFLSYPE